MTSGHESAWRRAGPREQGARLVALGGALAAVEAVAVFALARAFPALLVVAGGAVTLGAWLVVSGRSRWAKGPPPAPWWNAVALAALLGGASAGAALAARGLTG